MAAKSQPERVWRWLVNLWMLIIISLMVADFVLQGRYSQIITPISMVYVSLLSVYVTTKEYERWFLMYKGKHPGEIGVVVWTLLLLVMILICLINGDQYKIQQDVVTTYITVIVVFVITKASKQLFEQKNQHKKIKSKSK